jgi:hypothetical protein
MDDCGVTNRAVGPDIDSQVVSEVDDAAILNICSLADANCFNVRPKHSAVKDTGVAAKVDIADERGAGSNKSRLCGLGLRVEKPLETVFDIHGKAASHSRWRRPFV